MPDDCPQRPKAKAGLAIDRFDPRLAHQGVSLWALRLDPVSQKHPDRAALVPGQEVVRTFDPRVVPPKRPDSPAHARNRPTSPFVDHGERVLPEQIPEQEIRRGAGDPPAHRPSQGGGVTEPDRLCRMPQSTGVGFGGEAVAGAYLWIGKPFIEVGVHGSSTTPLPLLKDCRRPPSKRRFSSKAAIPGVLVPAAETSAFTRKRQRRFTSQFPRSRELPVQTGSFLALTMHLLRLALPFLNLFLHLLVAEARSPVGGLI